MYRGTNPIIKLELDLDTSLVADAYVTFVQGNTEITKPISECQCENKTISTQLTQEDTLAFKVGGVQVQARIKLTDGTLLATNIITLPVEQILHDGVLFESEETAEALTLNEEQTEPVVSEVE